MLLLQWTPNCERIVTGSSAGELTEWMGTTFNFVRIVQAHGHPIREMRWNRAGENFVSGDQSGFVQYRGADLGERKEFRAHEDAVRALAFSPSDEKFVTCSDDSSINVWQFSTATKERTMEGHNYDVRSVDWHPTKALLASGSRDGLVKLWDPTGGECLRTLRMHKRPVHHVEWNRNGHWLLTCSEDQTIRMNDLRMLREPVQTLQVESSEPTVTSWHPVHETMFAAGYLNGALRYWVAGETTPVAEEPRGHDACIWSLSWHPVGHMLLSGGNDHFTRFWVRPRPGDTIEQYRMKRDVRDWHTLSYDRQYDKSKKRVETERISQRLGRGRGSRGGGPAGRGGSGPGRGWAATPFGRPRMPVAQPVNSGPPAAAADRPATAPGGPPRFQGHPRRPYGFPPRGGHYPGPAPGAAMGGRGPPGMLGRGPPGMLGRGPPGMHAPPRGGPRGDGQGAPRGPGRGRGVHTTKPHWMQ